MIDLICQFWMVIFNLPGITLTTLNNKTLRKIGVTLGFISQPAFIITACIHEQWGFFILSAIYIFIWTNGILVQFFDFSVLEKLFKK